jgi:hypothetical protein
MSRSLSVLLVRPEFGWRPARACDAPPTVQSSRVYAPRVTVQQTVAIAQTFNTAHLPLGFFEGERAIIEDPESFAENGKDGAP